MTCRIMDEKGSTFQGWKYYMIINKERIYFDFSYTGLRDVQKYLLDNGIAKRKLYISRK